MPPMRHTFKTERRQQKIHLQAKHDPCHPAQTRTRILLLCRVSPVSPGSEKQGRGPCWQRCVGGRGRYHALSAPAELCDFSAAKKGQMHNWPVYSPAVYSLSVSSPSVSVLLCTVHFPQTSCPAPLSAPHRHIPLVLLFLRFNQACVGE